MTFGLGNRCSIRLSYGTKYLIMADKFYLGRFANMGVCYHFATQSFLHGAVGLAPP